MISKKDILKAARRITKRKSGTLDHRIMHPERDWAIGLAFSVSLLIIAVSYTGYEFLAHLEEAEQSVSVESSITEYDQQAVSDVLEHYSTQERRFEALRNDRSNAGSLQVNLEDDTSDSETLEETPTTNVEEGVTSTGTPEVSL